MNLSSEEKQLLISALEGDRLGKWGDGRQEKINRIIKKIKAK